MNTTRILFIFSLLMILYAQGNSQNNYRGCYGFDCKEKKWSFSLFAGFSALGPGRDIEEQMTASGLGDVRPAYDGWFGHAGRVDYPKRSTGMVWNLEAGYAISRKSGLELTAGKNYHSSVEGYDHIGLGNHLRISSDIWSVALNYVWKLRNGKDGIAVGPVLAIYKATADTANAYTNAASGTSTWKTGFNIGYTFSLVQKKSWYLALKTNYTWLPDAEIGPYVKEHQLGIATSNPETYTSTFHKTNVSLPNINFGISTGWRF